MSANTKAFLIHCSTGCSCCRDQNHYCGPFSSRDVALRFKSEFFHAAKVASQYAVRGHYSLREEDAEVLPDGRIIIETRVFPGWADDDGWTEIESAPFGRGE